MINEPLQSKIKYPQEGIGIPERFKRTATGRFSSDLVMSTILEDLMDGKLKPGDRVNASNLAKRLKVSIVPVREALHLLAGEGVIELLPLRGARIRGMNNEEVANWFKIYRVVVNIGLRGAALNIRSSPDNVAKVDDAMQLIRSAAGKTTPSRFIMTLLDLHRVVDTFSGIPEVDEAMRRLQVTFWCMLLPDFIPFEKYWDIYVRNYQRVADAIMIGDPDGAEAMFSYHVDWSIAVILGARPSPEEPWVPDIRS